MHFLILSMLLLMNSHFIFTEKPIVVNSIKSTNRQLSLKKRSLLFPNNGRVKLTIGYGKAILGNSPKGLSLSYELSGYYAGPTSLKERFAEFSQRSSHILNKTSKKNPFEIETHKHYNLLTYSRDPSMIYKGVMKNSKYSSKRSVVSSARTQDNKLASLLDEETKCRLLKFICRNQEFVLLPKYSMVQDIVRVIFLASTADEFQNEIGLRFCDSFAYCTN